MKLKLIDAHCHLNTVSRPKILKALDTGAAFVSINTEIPFFEPLTEQEKVVLGLKKDFPDRVRYVGSFSSEGFGAHYWQQTALDEIKRTLDRGASGIKIWKNFGMAKKDSHDRFIMADDERLDPLFGFLAEHNVPLLAHIGEPKNCWLPLEEMTVDSDRDYFRHHPEYHMYLHPNYPGYEKQIQARDNILEKHPNLVFVGAHLGSMEWNLDEVAKRLERYPHFMTDLAERICHVQLQSRMDREKVRKFMFRYQDRIMYGSDVIDDGHLGAVGIADRFGHLWQYHHDYFATEKIMTAREFSGEFQGLGLPEHVVEKIFHLNAFKLYGF